MSDNLHEVLFFCFRRHTFAIKLLSSSEKLLECYDSREGTSSAKYFRRVRFLAYSVFHIRRVSPLCICPHIYHLGSH